MAHPAQQIRFCTSRDGTRIAYATYGTGPRLVWAAHWIHHLKFDWDSPVWRPWLSALARHHTLIRYDLRGCGLSDREGVEFTFGKLVEDLEAVVKAVGVERFALFGMTGCARIAMSYLLRHPDTVSQLVLYGTSACGPLARNPPHEQLEETQTRLKAMELGWSQETPGYGQFFTSLHIPDANAEQSRSHNDLLRLTTSPGNAARLLRTLWESDVHDLLPQVRCPTLVLNSRQDAIQPFEEGRAIASAIPAARFVPLESRNHILLENEPAWQQFVEALDDFLPTSSAGLATLALDDLTSREREVLEFVAQGLDNSGISTRLKISEKTIRNHVSTIFSKLGVTSRAQAVAVARGVGFGRRIGP
jgi:pimeloyl-ACP methyl ester carboxylesterase/DNA-binding CsgD family transcriptional regulator